MIQVLKRIVLWLEARFPAKLVVALEDLEALADDINRIKERELSTVAAFGEVGERVLALEKSVAAIKDLLAKGGVTTLRTDAEKLRKEFVEGANRA